MTAPAISFIKGHGTGNDFVLLPAIPAGVEVTPALVRALCDRRLGVGGDGVLVLSRTADHGDVAEQAALAPYFMDYRNSDGSLAQMCGNGARVFAAHLVEAGLESSGSFHVATRGGAREVHIDSRGTVRVNMGPAQIMARDDIRVAVDNGSGLGTPAVGVLMPNPHAVTWVADVAAAGSLNSPPEVTPANAYPNGVNVEFVRPISPTHIQMRVFERGVGETLSCGTGACAAAVAHAQSTGTTRSGVRTRVDVPGGTVGVTWKPDGAVELDGPAEFVARGTLDPSWWELHV